MVHTQEAATGRDYKHGDRADLDDGLGGDVKFISKSSALA